LLRLIQAQKSQARHELKLPQKPAVEDLLALVATPENPARHVFDAVSAIIIAQLGTGGQMRRRWSGTDDDTRVRLDIS
jgi:hypothetical protein